ncbi:MAG TPA: PxKF domain-containing protein, partial [Blastocatellia bacterium]|nr:PxKF domain-containing protein [Blastocatellia bacterium]
LNTAPTGPDLNGFSPYYGIVLGTGIFGPGTFTSQGYNVVGSTDGATIAAATGDQFGVSAAQLNLGPLQDNGGPTPTMALGCGSVAIDQGISNDLITDQRSMGFVRTFNDPTVPDAIGGDGTDAGAFEVQAFIGFFQPVDNLPITNVVKAGRAIPIKFSLGGYKGLNIFAAGYPKSVSIACDFSGGTSDIQETVTAGNSNLSYDEATDTYTYVWKTSPAWKNTCRQLIVRLNGGCDQVANFRFR